MMNPYEAARHGALLALVDHHQRLVNAYAALAQWIRDRARRRRRRRTCQVRQWIARRPQLGLFNQLMPELRREDPASFTNMLRVPPEMFDELLGRIRHRIEKEHISRDTLDPGTVHFDDSLVIFFLRYIV